MRNGVAYGGGGGDDSTFIGTTAQWEALTTSEKAQYNIVDFTDDYSPSSGFCPLVIIYTTTGSTVTLSKTGTSVTAEEVETGKFAATMPDWGTYTITATLDGKETTGTVTINTVQIYEITLESTPEGATVTPTDDIQTWLACANLDKAYTTLAEVLADEETYETLLRDSNACDYMARSTTWAVAEGAVPTMTSNTTPSGTAYLSVTAQSGREAYFAFDGNDSIFCNDLGTTNPPIELSYEFAEKVCIKKIRLKSSRIATGKIQALDDNNTWIDLVSITGTADTTDNYYFILDNTVSYKKYRVYELTSTTSASNAARIIVYTFQLYTDADITTNETAMKYLGKYDYACEKLLGNATWAEAIANSDYFEYVLNTKVPKLSADSSSVITNLTVKATGYEKWHAFDGNTGGNFFYFQYTTSRTDGWVGYDFGAPVIIRKVSMFNISNTASIKQCKYQYSDDGTTWTDATELITNSLTGAWTDALIPSSIGAHRYWCAGNLDNNGDGGGAYIPELQFYGRKPLQDTVIVHSAPLDTIYYKINNLPVVVCTTNSDGIGEFDLDILDDGTYTLYSSVAKDPSNLSNDYSKEMRITKSQYGGTTELYFMPDAVKTLYWWGYESSNLEDLSSANGWSVSYSNISLSLGSVPTHNTNSIRIATTTSTISGVGTKNKILTTKMNILFTPITTTGAARIEVVQLKTSKYVTNQSDKYYYSTGNTTAAVNTMTLLDMNTSENDTYFEIDTWYGTVTDIHAIWYE